MGTSSTTDQSSMTPITMQSRLLFACCVFFVTCVSGTLRGPSIWWAAAIQHAILVGAALILVVQAFRQGPVITQRDDHKLVLSLAIFIGYLWWSASHAPMPRFTIASLLGLSSLGVATLVPWCLARRTPAWREHIVVGLSLLGGLVTLWSLLAWYRGGLDRPLSPMGHHNLLGAFLGMTLPLQWVSARGLRQGTLRWVLWGSLALGCLTLIASRSLGSVMGIGIAGAMMIWLDRAQMEGVFRSRTRIMVTASGLVIILVAGLFSSAGQEIASRVVSILSGAGDSSIAERLDYARAAIASTTAIHPWTGFGPGLTPFAFPLDRLQHFTRCECGFAVTHLHSLPIHVFYETGLVGLTFVVILWSAITRGLWRRLANAEGETLIALGVMGAWISYSVRCLTDVNFLAAGVTLTAGIIVGTGLSLPTGSRSRPGRPWADRLLLLATCLPVLVAVPAVLQVDRAHRTAAQARVMCMVPEPTTEDLETAFDLYIAADEKDPGLGFYAHEAAQVAERLALTTKDPQWLNQADRLFERALFTVPSVPGYAARLARLRMDHGQLEAALPPAYLAAALEQGSAFVQVPFVQLLVRLGQTTEAQAHLGQQIGRIPDTICYRAYAPDSLSAIRSAAVEIARRDFPDNAETIDHLMESCFTEDRSLSMVPFNRTDDSPPRFQRSMYIFRRKAIPSKIGQVHLNLTPAMKAQQKDRWNPETIAKRNNPTIDTRTTLLTTHTPAIGYFPSKFFGAE